MKELENKIEELIKSDTEENYLKVVDICEENNLMSWLCDSYPMVAYAYTEMLPNLPNIGGSITDLKSMDFSKNDNTYPKFMRDGHYGAKPPHPLPKPSYLEHKCIRKFFGNHFE